MALLGMTSLPFLADIFGELSWGFEILVTCALDLYG